MKKMKNNLDEMQEQNLLHVEKNCFWGLYWMLFAAMFLQIFTGGGIRKIAGEAVCFFAVSIVMVVQCLRKGIWDRRLKADRRTNLMVSGVAAGVVALLQAVHYFVDPYGYCRWGIGQLVAMMLIPGILTFFCCAALLTICTAVYKKRVAKMEFGEDKEEKESD